MNILVFSSEENEALTTLVNKSEQDLLEVGQSSATRAFNLGCSVSLLPAAILVILAFFLTRGSWVFGLISVLLALLAMVGVANLVASTAKEKATRRRFDEKVSLEIKQKLLELQMDHERFDLWVSKNLPDGAILRNYIALPPNPETESLDESISDQE